ncbi:MAG: substrate-binding domain-containing protein [Chthonomonadaceae bacterium]|nr:substrate-binding domain-containing protein [Chthonomonadaceae bacterium]
MPRPVTQKLIQLEASLTERLTSGNWQPGERFTSARELSAEAEIAYQTAHRLLARLCEAGLLVRHKGSGTYLPGGEQTLLGVDLFFDVRARRLDSFGARLLASLGKRLKLQNIPWRLCWSNETPLPEPSYFPVVWQSPDALAKCVSTRLPALLINERPTPGLEAMRIDSVSIDDFFGGVCAAQLLLEGVDRKGITGRGKKEFCIFAGPTHDPRSASRRDGFLSVIGEATVVTSAGWFLEDGRKVASDALERGKDGIFCANDRLAEAILQHCAAIKATCPPLIGFDDAPIAEALNLTTIAIPWNEFIADIAGVILQRINGDTSAARQRILTPYPVIRG